MFKIKSRYYPELLAPETMELRGSTKIKITRGKNGENVAYFEINEIVLIYWNVVIKSYQQNSRVLHICVPNKLFVQLLDISPNNFVFLKAFDWGVSYIEVWFTD